MFSVLRRSAGVLTAAAFMTGCVSRHTNQPVQDPMGHCAQYLINSFEWEEALDENWRIDLDVPNSDAALLYFGSSHGEPPESDQDERIRDALLNFKPTLILHEGEGWFKTSSELEALRAGEMAFVQYLAVQQSIAFDSHDATSAEKLTAMLKEYAARDVQLFIVLRYVANVRSDEGHEGEALRRRAEWKLQQTVDLGRKIGVDLPIRDLTGLQESVEAYWPGTSWRAVKPEWFTPLPRADAGKAVIFHEINRLENTFRNQVTYRKIATALERGERVFAIAGRNHVPLQRPALMCWSELQAKGAN